MTCIEEERVFAPHQTNQTPFFNKKQKGKKSWWLDLSDPRSVFNHGLEGHSGNFVQLLPVGAKVENLD